MTHFGLVIDGKFRQLWLSEKPIIKFALDPQFQDDLDACRGIALLSDTERDQIKGFPGQVIPPQPDKMPAAKLEIGRTKE